MRLPVEPIQLSVEQIEELNKKHATMRHDNNNHLALMLAAAELIKYKPEAADRMMQTLNDQPAKIGEAIGKFSEALDAALQIKQI